MKVLIIEKIEILELAVPLNRPFKTALRTCEHIETIVVKLTTDIGLIGYGEAVPTAAITGETKESIMCSIIKYITPAIIGMEVEDLEPLMKKLNECLVGNTSAKASVDMAIYDVLAQKYEVPLYRLLGGSKKTLKTDITISVNNINEMIQDSLCAVQDGYSILKVKVGKGKALEDAYIMEEIYKAVGKDIVLRVDANQGWEVKQSVQIIQYMEDKGLNIELVEQPVPAYDLKGMKKITQAVHTSILADESIFSAKQTIEVLQNGACDIVNIKLMKAGGIYNALKICTIAQTFGVSCMVGCMLETKLGVSAAAHLAAGQNIVTYVDLDGPALCKIDPYVGGPNFNGEYIEMTETHGIGITGIV